jgi:hypothetical protein
VKTDEQVTAPLVIKQVDFAREEEPVSEKAIGIITGVVLSAENDAPLPGAIISIKGTLASTTADMAGKFEIPQPGKNQDVLVADFIGMEQKEVTLDNKKDLRIVMEPSSEALEDLLISGYGNSVAPVSNGPDAASSKGEKAGTYSYQPAAPADGSRRYRNYISDNIKFPENTDLTRAVVVLSFVVDPSGKPFTDTRATMDAGTEKWQLPRRGNQDQDLIRKEKLKNPA